MSTASTASIEHLKEEWHASFSEMKKYFYNEIFDTFRITYDAKTWYRFKNPALIYPVEREMRFSTPNERVNFDYYPTFLSKLGMVSHNFAYLADIDEFYGGDLRMFLAEQSRFVTPLQRANLRIAHFVPDALVEVTARGLRSFMRLKSSPEAEIGGEYEEVLVILETLGLMGMPRRDDVISFFEELNERSPDFVKVFLQTQNFSFAGIATPPWLNEDKKFGIRRRTALIHAGRILARMLERRMRREDALSELENIGFAVRLEDEDFRPEDVVDMRWINLERAIERVERSLRFYEHKASRRSTFHCYEDFSSALRRIYEREERALSYFR